MKDKLAEIQAAIDRFQMDEARALAERELVENPSAEAYYLASQAALSHGQRVELLEKALALDPEHAAAAQELADMQPPDLTKTETSEEAAAPEIKLAGLTRRFVALIIDAFVIAIVTVAIMAAGDGFAPLYDAMYSDDELALTAAFNQFQTDTVGINLLVSALYNALLMTWLNGQTLGKLMLRIRVVKKNGRRINLLDALLRNVFGYTVSQILLLGYLWAIVDDEQQAWHDKMAATIVVDERNPSAE